MGNFYTNFTLKTADTDRVITALGRRAAYVATVGRHTIVYDKECDTQNDKAIAKLGKELSTTLGCPALAALVHDDDLFWYGLFETGSLVDEYTSRPGFYNDKPDTPPEGGNSSRLCAAFDVRGREAKVDAVLSAGPAHYTFEHERHADLVKAIGLPEAAVASGFNYIEDGEPPDIPDGTLRRVG